MTHECQCDGSEQRRPNGSFWCEAHQMWKTQHYRDLCRTRPEYRAAWNAGAGPGQQDYGQISPAAASRQEAKEGLGDRAERLLKSLGVTPERYVEVKRLFGLPPTCGCAKRKEWLNKVGQWLSGE